MPALISRVKAIKVLFRLRISEARLAFEEHSDGPEKGEDKATVNIKPIAKFLYGFFAAVFLIVGATVLLLHTGLLPGAVRSIVMRAAHDDLNAVHLIQEFGSLLVFAGLVSVWFIRHYEQSKFFHWAMTTFWALFALVHWLDFKGPFQSAIGPTINTIPFVLFAIVGLLRKNSGEKR
ncbi:MAG: hypothetical protein AABO57_15235 [Acidobacteriota bacterium]